MTRPGSGSEPRCRAWFPAGHAGPCARAAAGQLGRRASRTNKAIGKTMAVIYDYKDQFNTGFRQKATKRRHSYAEHDWEQIHPGQKKNERPQYTLWED